MTVSAYSLGAEKPGSRPFLPARSSLLPRGASTHPVSPSPGVRTCLCDFFQSRNFARGAARESWHGGSCALDEKNFRDKDWPGASEGHRVPLCDLNRHVHSSKPFSLSCLLCKVFPERCQEKKSESEHFPSSLPSALSSFRLWGWAPAAAASVDLGPAHR